MLPSMLLWKGILRRGNSLFSSSPFTRNLSVQFHCFLLCLFVFFLQKADICMLSLYTCIFLFMLSALIFFFNNISLGEKWSFRDNNISYMECGSNNKEEYTKKENESTEDEHCTHIEDSKVTSFRHIQHVPVHTELYASLNFRYKTKTPSLHFCLLFSVEELSFLKS